jgi:deazaflavin-dependent oxidoreductase (nitroreductase family)
LDRVGVRLWTRLDVAFYKAFGFSLAAKMMQVDVLLLRTTGRRTGRRREALVACLELDGRIVVGGGNWGWDADPGWSYNVAANPAVEVVRGRRAERRAARVLDGAEAQRTREALAAAYPHSQNYVARRQRPIPVVELTRRRP